MHEKIPSTSCQITSTPLLKMNMQQKNKEMYLGKTNFPGKDSFGKFLVGPSVASILLFVSKSTWKVKPLISIRT